MNVDCVFDADDAASHNSSASTGSSHTPATDTADRTFSETATADTVKGAAS